MKPIWIYFLSITIIKKNLSGMLILCLADMDSTIYWYTLDIPLQHFYGSCLNYCFLLFIILTLGTTQFFDVPSHFHKQRTAWLTLYYCWGWEGGQGLQNINSRWAMGGREGSGWGRVAFQIIFEINLHVCLIIWFQFPHQIGPYSDVNIKNKTFATKTWKQAFYETSMYLYMGKFKRSLIKWRPTLTERGKLLT